MELIRGLGNLHQQTTGCVATIGNFDGIHLGHQAIVTRVISKARLLGLPSCVLLFEPHPKEFFMGDGGPARLTCFGEKYRLLKSLGIDKIVVLQFNQSMLNMDAVEFVSEILMKRLMVRHLVVGDDFHFGHRRKGNFQLLAKMSSGQYSLEPTPSVLIENERVSSTLVREALSAHDLGKAAQLLGRRYSMSGKVGYGQQLGRTINFPTANVAIKRKKIALRGVFLVRCHWQQDNTERAAWGAANCGIRPTVDGKNYRLEVHLFDVSPALYGVELAVEFYAFIREEKKFSGIDELRLQIARDIDVARQLITDITVPEVSPTQK